MNSISIATMRKWRVVNTLLAITIVINLLPLVNLGLLMGNFSWENRNVSAICITALAVLIVRAFFLCGSSLVLGVGLLVLVAVEILLLVKNGVF
jgi:hypothetical protein